MAENKQNSETKNTTEENKNTVGGASSPKLAREENQSPGKPATANSTPAGKNDAPTGGTNAAETLTGVKETVGAAAAEVAGQAKEKADSVLGEQKTNLAAGITSVADSIRQVGENISHSNENNQVAALAGKYGDTLAQQVEKFSSYIQDKEIKELVRDVEQFAKRNPIVFVSGAFALGILAARFLKSSSNQASAGRGRNKRSQN